MLELELACSGAVLRGRVRGRVRGRIRGRVRGRIRVTGSDQGEGQG